MTQVINLSVQVGDNKPLGYPGYPDNLVGEFATLVSGVGYKLRGSSEIDGTGSRVRVSDPPVPRNYERVKLNLLRDTGWRLKVSGSARGL